MEASPDSPGAEVDTGTQPASARANGAAVAQASSEPAQDVHAWRDGCLALGYPAEGLHSLVHGYILTSPFRAADL